MRKPTLTKRLKELAAENPKQFVYLCSGSQFWFIGTVEDALRRMTRLSRDYQQNLINLLRKNEDKQRSYPSLLIKHRMDFKGFSRELDEIQGKLERKEYTSRATRMDAEYKVVWLRDRVEYSETRVKTLESEIEKLPARIKGYKERIATWKPFGSRLVIEEHERFTKPNGLVLKTTGQDYGAYWTYDEFVKCPGIVGDRYHEERHNGK